MRVCDWIWRWTRMVPGTVLGMMLLLGSCSSTSMYGENDTDDMPLCKSPSSESLLFNVEIASTGEQSDAFELHYNSHTYPTDTDSGGELISQTCNDGTCQLNFEGWSRDSGFLLIWRLWRNGEIIFTSDDMIDAPTSADMVACEWCDLEGCRPSRYLDATFAFSCVESGCPVEYPDCGLSVPPSPMMRIRVVSNSDNYIDYDLQADAAVLSELTAAGDFQSSQECDGRSCVHTYWLETISTPNKFLFALENDDTTMLEYEWSDIVWETQTCKSCDDTDCALYDRAFAATTFK